MESFVKKQVIAVVFLVASSCFAYADSNCNVRVYSKSLLNKIHGGSNSHLSGYTLSESIDQCIKLAFGVLEDVEKYPRHYNADQGQKLFSKYVFTFVDEDGTKVTSEGVVQH